MKNHKYTIALAVTLFLFLIICILIAMAALGSGMTLWWGTGQTNIVAATLTSTRVRAVLASPAPTFSPTPTVAVPTQTATLTPTHTPTFTPVPPSPTATSVPPTATLTPTATLPPLPTATFTPEPTLTPAFAFEMLEFNAFPTTHLNFDVYVAITNDNNKPLPGYRMLGLHSGGLQVDSQFSAAQWTQNSGAKHYKAGNIKYEVFNSPGGVWTLQLVNEEGQPVAPPLECPFDANNPTWYFVLYKEL